VTDLRDQLPDFEAAARRLIQPDAPIPLTRASDLGRLLRELRHRAGLSQNALAVRAHVTKSGLSAREQRSGMTVGALVDHARALGYDVALIPRTDLPRPRLALVPTPDRRTA
jgi:transcriptional regulator with XRE-family HTH domain